MKLRDFNYHLPKNLIAQKPIRPRDHSRLLIIRRGATRLDSRPARLANAAHPNSIRIRRRAIPQYCGTAHPNGNRNRGNFKIEHKYFYDIIDYLRAGDMLVLNNSKVFPARLIGKKEKTGGRIEVFLLKTSPPSPLLIRRGVRGEVGEVWQCLVGGKNRKEGQKIKFSQSLKAEIIKDNQDGTWQVKFNKSRADFQKIIQSIGQVPLPPYIKRKAGQPFKLDCKDYQTIYADPKKLGSVAAPTAGFHFTPALLNKLKAKGVQIEFITLHVGLGTFAPVKFDDISKHKMQAEWVEVDKEVIGRIIKAKQEGRRIIAVGTTSVRTLESIFSGMSNVKCQMSNQNLKSKILNRKFEGWTNIFIFPPYKFKVIDAIITNFHLPKSTLLMLVCAFACTERSRSAGRSKIFKAYQQAIKRKYRFYSYGDAMFIY